MITPFLEKLILTGRAQVKTFVAGSAKNVLTVPENHFIIIHHFDHFPFNPSKIDEQTLGVVWRNLVTQMKIFSDKGYSTWVIRNSIIGGVGLQGGTTFTSLWSPGNHYPVDCYLVHETDVSISISKTAIPTATVNAIAPTTVPARIPAADYGKVGQPGALQVGTYKTVGAASEYRPLNKYSAPSAIANNSYEQLEFPIDGTTRLQSSEIEFSQASYPLVNFQYLEIKGRPTDLAPTN